MQAVIDPKKPLKLEREGHIEAGKMIGSNGTWQKQKRDKEWKLIASSERSMNGLFWVRYRRGSTRIQEERAEMGEGKMRKGKAKNEVPLVLWTSEIFWNVGQRRYSESLHGELTVDRNM